MTILSTGFERNKLTEIKAEYDALVTTALGAVNTAPDSVIGQLEGIWAEAIDNANEVLQDTYDSMYPSTAEGTSLDGAVSFVKLLRLGATSTLVTAAAYGVQGTVIPLGHLARSDVLYKSTLSTTISNANALDVTIDITTLTNSSLYTITAGGITQNYTSDATATKAEIAAAFVASFNTGIFVCELSGTESIRIYSQDLESAFAITVGSKLTIAKLGSPVLYAADIKGAVACPANTVINIETVIAGLSGISNLKAGTIGRNIETDSELRIRHRLSTRSTGSATVEAIRARMLQDVPTVASIAIYENRTGAVNVFGMPPHSFEAVVVGGTNKEVADQLWITKPAGIETHGAISNNVTDSNGDVQTVKFTRHVPLYGWLTINVSLYTEEALPVEAANAIKDACVAYSVANFSAGKDVILQRFFGSIYSTVAGIGSLTITGAVTPLPNGTPSYNGANIAIGRSEYAVFDVSRITVIGV